MARILSLLDKARSQNMLAVTLPRQYELIQWPSAPSKIAADFLNQPFDIALVDASALDYLATPLAQRKRTEDSVFLPILLITERKNFAKTVGHLGTQIDEILLIPFEAAELQLRLEGLLQRRALSRELHNRMANKAGPLDDLLPKVLERISDACVALDHDWRYTYVNRRAGELFGREPESLIGKHIWTEFPEGKGQPFHKAYEQALATQQQIYLEEYYAPWNRWFENRIFPSPEGLTIFFHEITERKCMQMMLQEREHFLQHVLDMEPGTVYIHDLTKRCNVYVNRHWLSSYGYSTTETQDMGAEIIARICHPDDVQRIAAHHDAWRQAKDSEMRTIKYRIRTKNGEWCWLHSRETAFARDQHGYVNQIIGIAQDITEELKLKAKLQCQDKLLRETGELAKIGGWEFDPVTGEGTWTDEVARIHDMTPTEYTNAAIGLSFYQGAHRQAIETAIKQAIEHGTPYDLELEINTAKGVRKWVRTIGRPVRQGNKIIKLRGACQDITDRKMSEKALQESEERFRAVFEQAAVGIARVALNGYWLQVNQKICDIVGYTKNELLARSFQDITYPPDLNADLEFVRCMLAGKICNYSMEKRYIRKDGFLVWINLTVSLVREPSGSPKYFISVIEDISDRKRSEPALAEV